MTALRCHALLLATASAGPGAAVLATLAAPALVAAQPPGGQQAMVWPAMVWQMPCTSPAWWRR